MSIFTKKSYAIEVSDSQFVEVFERIAVFTLTESVPLVISLRKKVDLYLETHYMGLIVQGYLWGPGTLRYHIDGRVSFQVKK